MEEKIFLVRLNAAIAKTNEKLVEAKKEVSEKLWPNAKEETRGVNMSRLTRGKIRFFTIEQLDNICKALNVTPNYLLGYE